MQDRGPITVEQCLEYLLDGRGRVEALLARIDDPERTLDDGWNAKDILMHLARWQERVAGWFEEAASGGTPERPEPGYSFEQTDELNERDRETGRAATIEEARQAFGDSYERVAAVIRSLSDEELNDPARFGWLGFEARSAIAGNSYGHYRDHTDALEELVLGSEFIR